MATHAINRPTLLFTAHQPKARPLETQTTCKIAESDTPKPPSVPKRAMPILDPASHSPNPSLKSTRSAEHEQGHQAGADHGGRGAAQDEMADRAVPVGTHDEEIHPA